MLLLELFPELSLRPENLRSVKDMILQLAIHGKLTAKWREENPDVEPASELLKRIEEEKERLVKEKKIRREKALPPITQDEIPFEIPESWEWKRLGDTILEIYGGGTPSKRVTKYWGGDIPWASVKDLKDYRYLERTQDSITLDGLKGSSANLVSPGNLIVCTRMGLGKIVLSKITTAINQDLKAIILPSEMDSLFILNQYKTLNIKGSGMTVSGIKQNELLNFCFAIAPIAEQKEIVRIVDHLFDEVDQLEKWATRRLELKNGFATSALNELTTSDNTAESWNYLKGHFKDFMDSEESINKLKETVLQLAIQGKLTAKWREENPNVEPASELLKRIKEEKERLVKEEKIRKEKALAPITRDEIPFEIPESWEWTRLGKAITYGTREKVNYENVEPNTWVLELEDVEKTTSRIINRKTAKERLFKSSKSVFREGDVVYGKLRPYLDKVIIARKDGVCTTEMIPIKCHANRSGYVRWFLKSPWFIRNANDSTHGMNLPRLGTEQAISIPFCIPPLPEQKEIVRIVDELNQVINELKKRFKETSALNKELVQSLTTDLN